MFHLFSVDTILKAIDKIPKIKQTAPIIIKV